MNKEQKEGVLIVAVLTVSLLIASLFTEWRFGFGPAYLCIDLFKVSCTTEIAGFICKDDGFVHPIEFCVSFKYLLIVHMLIGSYGLLRAFGIVRRLFKFEEKLFQFIE